MSDSKLATKRRLKQEEAKGHYHRFNHPSDHRHWVKVMPGGVYTTTDQEIIHTGLGFLCFSLCLGYRNESGRNEPFPTAFS